MEAALPAGQPQGPMNHFLLPVPRYYSIIFSIRTQAKRNERRFSGTERPIRIPTKRVPGLFRNANRQKNRRSPRRDGPSRTRSPASCGLGILNNAFGGDLAMLYYDANGGTGHVFNREIAFVGGSVTALSYQIPGAFITPPAGKSFCGWNTKADGTGTTYRPGERIPLTTNTTTLYALWDAPETPNTEPSANPSGNSGSRASLWQRIKNFFNKIAEFFRRLFR